MADLYATLTPRQATVFAILEDASPERGLLSSEIARQIGGKTGSVTPKLKALERKGFAFRHPTNVERWSVKPWEPAHV